MRIRERVLLTAAAGVSPASASGHARCQGTLLACPESSRVFTIALPP